MAKSSWYESTLLYQRSVTWNLEGQWKTEPLRAQFRRVISCSLQQLTYMNVESPLNIPKIISAYKHWVRALHLENDHPANQPTDWCDCDTKTQCHLIRVNLMSVRVAPDIPPESFLALARKMKRNQSFIVTSDTGTWKVTLTKKKRFGGLRSQRPLLDFPLMAVSAIIRVSTNGGIVIRCDAAKWWWHL